MKHTKISILALIALVLSILFSTITYSIVPLQLSDQGTSVKDMAGQTLNIGNLSVYIYDSETSGNLLWNNTFINAIDNGSWNVMLGETLELNLSYGEKYWKDYKINGHDLNYTNNTHGTTERKAFYAPIGEINKTFIENRSNVFVDIAGDTMIGDLIVTNTTGKLFFVNTSGERVEIWNPSEGANDYLSLWHDGSHGYIKSGVGTLYLQTPPGNLLWDGTNLYSTRTANTGIFGGSNREWKKLYLGEDAGSGAYFGLDQNSRIYYNETSRDELVIESVPNNISIVTPELKIWDDAEGANDYLSLYHTGIDAVLKAASGAIKFNSGGTITATVGTNALYSGGSNSFDLGVTNNEWRGLYLGEDALSGAYYGLDQDWRLYYNETSEDALILQNKTGHNIMSWEGGKVGIGTSSPSAMLDIELSSGGALAVGSSNTFATGNYAIALGNKNNASAIGTIVIGTNSRANNSYAIAIGRSANATGPDSLALGYDTTASGHYSTTIGYKTIASGYQSFSSGYRSTASGPQSAAMGFATTASNDDAMAFGSMTIAAGLFSTAMGHQTQARGKTSTALGEDIIAFGNYSFGIGLDNTQRNITDNNTMAIVGGKLGIGTPSPTANYILDVNGSMLVQGNLNVTGTSYLGDLIINAENITTTNILPKSKDKGINIYNDSDGLLLRVNATAGRTEFWDEAGGAGDYTYIYHDGTQGLIGSGSGAIVMSNPSYNLWSTTAAEVYIAGANVGYLGSTSNEWKRLYLGEDATSGAYFGLDQDWRMYYNESVEDALILTDGGTNISFDSIGMGIGTLSPSAALHILSPNIGITEGLVLENAVAADEYLLAAGINGVTSDGFSIYDKTNSANRLVIEGSGDIGLGGQTAPGMALHVGKGSSNRGLTNSENDTYITGKLEVDKQSYFDAGVDFAINANLADNAVLILGTGDDSMLDWSTGQATEHSLVWALGDDSKSLIFTDYTNRNDDYDHPAQSNPTIFMHSDEDPDNDNTKWGSVSHDNSSFVIDSGYGNITLDDTIQVAGNVELSDGNIGTELAVMYDDGTFFHINTTNNISISNNVKISGNLNVTGLCVAENSMISMADGNKKKITEIKPGEQVLSLNENTGKIVSNKVKAVLDMGYKPVFNLTTEDGRSIKTTGNHPYLTQKGWIKVKDLTTEDKIAVPITKNKDNIQKQNLFPVSNVVMLETIKDDSISFKPEEKNKGSNLNSFVITKTMPEILEMFIDTKSIRFNDLLYLLSDSESKILVLSPEFIKTFLQLRRNIKKESHFNPINLSNLSKVIGIEDSFLASLSSLINSSLNSNSSTGYQSILSQNSWSSSDNLPVLINSSNILFLFNLSFDTSDQLTQWNLSIIENILSSNGKDTLTIYNSPLCLNLSNLSAISTTPCLATSDQFICGILSNLSFNSLGMDTVNLFIFTPLCVNKRKCVDVYKGFDLEGGYYKENNSLASKTTSIYSAPANLYRLATALLTFLPNLNASFSVNSLSDLNSLKNSKSPIFCLNACLATADQFISEKPSILCFNSSGTDKVIVVILNTSMCDYINYVQIYKGLDTQWEKVSELKKGKEIIMHELEEKPYLSLGELSSDLDGIKNLYPNDLSLSTSCLVLKTSTTDCPLKCGSLDQIGILLNANDKARYSVSSLSEIRELAFSRNLSNLSFGTDSILALIFLDNSSNSSDDNWDNSSILGLCFSNSSPKYSGAFNFTACEKIISFVIPVPINPVNKTVASITNSIYDSPGYIFLYLLCNDLFTSLPSINASFSVNLDLDTIFLKVSKTSCNFNCLSASSLANSDQFTQGNFSIISLKSPEIFNAMLTIYNSPLFLIFSNFSNASALFFNPDLNTSGQLISEYSSILFFNSSGIDNVNVCILIQPPVYEQHIVNTQKDVEIYKGLDTSSPRKPTNYKLIPITELYNQTRFRFLKSDQSKPILVSILPSSTRIATANKDSKPITGGECITPIHNNIKARTENIIKPHAMILSTKSNFSPITIYLPPKTASAINPDTMPPIAAITTLKNKSMSNTKLNKTAITTNTAIPTELGILSLDNNEITSNKKANNNYIKLSKNSNIHSEWKWAKIKSIEHIGTEHVYDLMIENTHNFIANDIIAHNTYLGEVEFSAENISVTNILPKDKNKGINIYNDSDGLLLRVNATSGRTEFWDEGGAVNDYVSVYHDGSSGYVTTGAGVLWLTSGAATLGWDTASFYPVAAGAELLGYPTYEWKGLYLGEDAGSGTYYGLDQDVQMWYNNTNRTLFIESSAANVSVIAPEFRIYDDAKGTGDYISIEHDGTYARINAQTGGTIFEQGGTPIALVATGEFRSTGSNRDDLGATAQEWQGLYIGENASSGTYFGVAQNYRTFYDTITGLNTTGSLNYTLDSDVKITGKLYGGSPLEVGSNLTVFGSLNVTGTSYLGDLVIDSDNITVANLIGRGGDNIRIGNAGADTHSLAADDDLFISGKLEVDGITYLDGFTYGFATVNMQDNIEIAFGGGLDSYLDWSGPQSTENTLVWGLGATSKSIIFTDVADRNRDYDHPAQSNPTIFMHSDQDPDEGNTQWGSIAHDNVSMVIDSGSDNITLDDDTNVAGDLALGDNQVGEELLAIEDNGTDVLFTTNNPVVFNHNVTSENLFTPAYIRAGSNATIPVAGVGIWTNISFDKKAETTKLNIEHTWNDNTNKTFTINDAGVYQVDYTVSIADSSPTPDAHVGFQLADGSDDSRIPGSYSEIDTVKQNADIFIHNSFLTTFTAGQTVMMQFTASDADVSVVQHGTYNPSPGSAQLSIHKFSN